MSKNLTTKQLTQIIRFLSTVEATKSTLRHNWTRTGRQESVAEHSWRVTLLAIVVYQMVQPKINFVKMLKMLVIHDIPEIIEGDIPGFLPANKTKYSKELQHAKHIFKILPSPLKEEFINLFKEFEEGETPEARWAQVMDKIESQLQHLDSGYRYWSKEEVGKHMLTYPDKVLKKLGNQTMNQLWSLIKADLKKETLKWQRANKSIKRKR